MAVLARAVSMMMESDMTRAFGPAFELRRVASLHDALALLASEPGTWRPFAGGTDVMVLAGAGALTHRRFVNLWGIAELRAISWDRETVAIGALTTYTDVRRDGQLAREFPLLGQAAAETGAAATQNRGTIGGNIANASPAADTPPVLLVYDAEIELASARGSRRVPYAQFHSGYKRMDLAADELIVRIWLPRGRSRTAQAFRKVGARRAQAISKVCFAATVDMAEREVRDVRIAFASVAPTVVRCRHVEAALRGHSMSPGLVSAGVRELLKDISPIDDIRSTAAYRRKVSQNLLREFLMRLVD